MAKAVNDKDFETYDKVMDQKNQLIILKCAFYWIL